MPKFNATQSVLINAPIDDVYSVVSDFTSWPKWSPWLICEPECEVTHAADGKSYAWNGKVVGSGEMERVEEYKDELIEYRLTFLKPWKSVSMVRMKFSEENGGTEVVWTMDGSLPFFMFWMKPMMTAMIESDFGRGLGMLKDLLEKGSVPSKLDFEGVVSVDGFDYVGVRTQCAISEVGPSMEKDLWHLYEWTGSVSLVASGKPFSIYHSYEFVKGFTEYTIGIPVGSVPSSLGEGVVSGSLPACNAFEVRHTGPYRHLGNAWSAGMMYGRSKVFKQDKKAPPFEFYENSPKDVAENNLVTRVFFPSK